MEQVGVMDAPFWPVILPSWIDVTGGVMAGSIDRPPPP
jgi:hypothetical protein